MNVNELKQLIKEAVNEVDFSSGYDEKEEIRKIQNIANLAKVAFRQDNPESMKKYLALINDTAEELIAMHNIKEGYGTGPNDPKAAGNWKVHYPSEKDWKKNKKSLSAVYQQQESK